MTNTKTKRTLLIALLSALPLAACGGGSDSGSSDGATKPAPEAQLRFGQANWGEAEFTARTNQ